MNNFEQKGRKPKPEDREIDLGKGSRRVEGGSPGIDPIVAMAGAGLCDAPCARESSITFPLTPTLSLREREWRGGIHTGMRIIRRTWAILPLPKGEGWGEGEGNVGSPALLISN